MIMTSTSEDDPEENYVFEIIYDKHGNKIATYAGGQPDTKTKFAYNTQGKVLKSTSFRADGTEIEAADTIAGLEHNALLDEYAAYYDLEQALFRKSMQNV